MFIKGIRIFDGENILCVKLIDILKTISNKKDLNWMILFLDGMPSPGEGVFFNEYKNKINHRNGTLIDWEELLLLSDKFFQIYEIVLIGDQNANKLHSYHLDEEMYESCEMVIELIDCAFWEVHSKDLVIIHVLKKKFKKVELLY